MAIFRFELEALLAYRRHQLDQCRQLMAEVLADHQQFVDQQTEIAEDRAAMLEQIREDSVFGQVDIRRAAASRYYVSQLDGQKRALAAQLNRTEQQLELCRQAVQQADAAVKVLEKLKEKRFKVFQQKELAREELMLNESWAASARGQHDAGF